MFGNYLRITLRNLRKHKAYSLINIAGLTIGMACSILILLWVQNEKSYDRFHANADRIYRITCNASEFKAAVNPAAMPDGLKREIPGIENYVRFTHLTTTLFEAGEKKFEEKNTFYVDSTLDQIFSFEFAAGNKATALDRPDAVLITEAMATKYFGKENPLGKTLKRNNSDFVTVTGVLRNIPANSHIQFDFLMPMSAIAQQDGDLRENRWGNFNFYSYLLLEKPLADKSVEKVNFEKKMDAIFQKHQEGFKVKFQLQPLTDIHLYSNLQVDLAGHGNVQYVNIFMVVAIFILVVACINFMNLATARSARRAREVGIRKVAGALRLQLIMQFIGESLIISIISLLIAIGIVFLVLPLFNDIAGKSIAISFIDGKIWGGLLLMAIVTGIISGSYPALFLSGFKPVKVLKGSLNKSGGNLVFRNALVVTQFIVSIMLLVGTVVVYRQLNFIHTRSMGFDKENLVYVPMTGELWQKKDAMNAALKQDPLTGNYTIINELPTSLITGTIDVQWDGKDPNLQTIFPSIAITENFIEVFKMKILAGRSFSKDFPGDSSNFIVNETTLKVMGVRLKDAIGKKLSMWNMKGMIVGVVKDFNFKPIQHPIEPLILHLNTWSGGYICVRTTPGNTEGTINALRKMSATLNPAYPFSFDFIDQDIANLYKGEERLGNLFNIFSALAIFISCLGLYGLSAFMAEQRKREIGVRKVLGASVTNIVYLLSTGFTKLILIAIVIAVPLSWFAINSWLESFAYHIEISWIIFVIASVAALVVAWLTVSYESIVAALTNPTKSLRAD